LSDFFALIRELVYYASDMPGQADRRIRMALPYEVTLTGQLPDGTVKVTELYNEDGVLVAISRREVRQLGEEGSSDVTQSFDAGGKLRLARFLQVTDDPERSYLTATEGVVVYEKGGTPYHETLFVYPRERRASGQGE